MPFLQLIFVVESHFSSFPSLSADFTRLSPLYVSFSSSRLSWITGLPLDLVENSEDLQVRIKNSDDQARCPKKFCPDYMASVEESQFDFYILHFLA